MEPKIKSGHRVPGSRVELGTRIGQVLDLFESRKSAAMAAGVSHDQLTKYIAGENKPSLEAMARLAAAKGVSLDWLAYGRGPMRPGDGATDAGRDDDGQLVVDMEELALSIESSEDWFRMKNLDTDDVPSNLKAKIIAHFYVYNLRKKAVEQSKGDPEKIRLMRQEIAAMKALAKLLPDD